MFKNGLKHITYDTSVNNNNEITATIDRTLDNTTYAQDDRLSIGMLLYQVSDQENINYQYNQQDTQITLTDFSYIFSMNLYSSEQSTTRRNDHLQPISFHWVFLGF